VEIPVLPDARRERFREAYGLGEEAAAKLTSTKQVADFYEDVAGEFDPDLAATWVADNLLGELNYRDMAVTDVADRLDEVHRLVELVAEHEITAKNAGEDGAINFLVGQVMQATGGSADPGDVNRLLREELEA
jgi:aspartyl-tRNA(Asn)/glutamyl-tRNA(Gln) amidotransferase subunit B